MTSFIMVQARLGSKRFPKKVLSKVGKNRMIDIQFKRLKKVKSKKKNRLFNP